MVRVGLVKHKDNLYLFLPLQGFWKRPTSVEEMANRKASLALWRDEYRIHYGLATVEEIEAEREEQRRHRHADVTSAKEAKAKAEEEKAIAAHSGVTVVVSVKEKEEQPPPAAAVDKNILDELAEAAAEATIE